jgi:MFS transporter, FHS family, L-fucose permease
MNVSKARSTLLQASYFGAYFLVALPAGLFMNKFGYRRGIIVGLSLFAAGAFCFTFLLPQILPTIPSSTSFLALS